MAKRRKKAVSRKKVGVKKRAGRKKKAPKPTILSPEDLRRFVAAQAALTRANMDRGLILAGVEAMSVAIQKFYGITGRFEVDPRTGLIIEEGSNGTT